MTDPIPLHDTPWHLVYTKPREEFIAVENLERQGFEVYLPLFRRQKMRGKQVSLVDEPLFPRYLFVRLPPDQPGVGWVTLGERMDGQAGPGLQQPVHAAG